MIKIVLLVALGGALGSAARFLIGRASLSLWGPDTPWGTVIVNVAGCFAMGALEGLMAEYSEISREVRSFLLIGLIGGFTTFSAFAFDFVTLYERGALLNAAFYLAGSIIVSILALLGGLYLVRNLIS